MHYSQQKWIRSGPRKLANVYAGHSHLPHNRRDLARSRSYKRLWHASQGPRNRSGGPSKCTATLCYSVTAAGSSGGREGAGATTQVSVTSTASSTNRLACKALSKPRLPSAGAGQETFPAEICAGHPARGYGRLCSACPCSCETALYLFCIYAPPLYQVLSHRLPSMV